MSMQTAMYARIEFKQILLARALIEMPDVEACVRMA